jgi:hypothetical protein
MFRSRRSPFVAAAVLLLAACGGGGDSTDRQRNTALEELCTYSPTGTVEAGGSDVTLAFCEQASTFTVVTGDQRLGNVLAPAAEGVTFNIAEQGGSVQVVVRTAATSSSEEGAGAFYSGATVIERVEVALDENNAVVITRMEDKTVTSGCLTVNDNETVPFSGTEQIYTARLTCEGAAQFTVDMPDGPRTLDINEGMVQWLVPQGDSALPYKVVDTGDTRLEFGNLNLTNSARITSIEVTGGTLADGAGETATTVEGEPQEPGAEETTTTLEGAPAEETTTSAAGSGELTLEEKWADCRNAPQVTFDKEEVERTGTLSYTVKWPCLKYMNGERFQQSVWHSFNDRTYNQLAVEGDALKANLEGDTYTYSSPISAGAYDIIISVSYNGFDHSWYDTAWFDYFDASFTVTSAVASSFDQCSRSDVKVSRGKLSMNCDLTAPLELRLTEDWELLPSENGVVDLAGMKDGWNTGSLKVQSGPVGFYVFGLFCSTKCDVPRESLNVERTIGDDNFWTFKVTRPSWCAEPIIAWLHGYTYRTLGRGVREEIDGETFWEDLEFGLVVNPETSLVRIGDDRYWCSDAFGNWQTEAVWADFIVTDDPAETPETTTTVETPSTTEAPAPATTVPAGPVADVAPAVLLPRADGSPAEIQVPSNSGGLGVSAASIEAILANAKTDVPVVLATFDTGDRVALRRGRDEVLKVPAGAKSVTFTAFKKDGTKVESTAKLVTVKPLVKVAITDSSSGGSGFPVLPVGAAALVLLAGAAFVIVRRRGNAANT